MTLTEEEKRGKETKLHRVKTDNDGHEERASHTFIIVMMGK